QDPAIRLALFGYGARRRAGALLDPLELCGQRAQPVADCAIDPGRRGASDRAVDHLADRRGLAFDLVADLRPEPPPLGQQVIGAAQDLAEVIADVIERPCCITHRGPPGRRHRPRSRASYPWCASTTARSEAVRRA